jgi:hypothetical protein
MAVGQSCVGQKTWNHLLGTIFVQRLFKVSSAPSRASASNIGKIAKKIKILQSFLDFFKSFV